MKYLLAASMMLGLAACTSVTVKPVSGDIAMKDVCILTNPP